MLQKFKDRYLTKQAIKRLGFGILITIPVIVYIFKISVLNRNGIFHGEDWDYFAQAYEAARQSIVHYHQFPWWNPWSNGGQPLFANPQFGLFSLQMPLVLLFGTVAGLHLSLMAYFVAGFWGMYLLIRRLGATDRLLPILLSYIWTFSGFSAWHLSGGHYTFAMYLLAPWAFLATLNIHKKLGWLWLGLIASLLIQSAMHYLTIEALIICALIALVQIIRVGRAQHLQTVKAFVPIIKPYVFAGIVVILLCGMRLIYTLQFTGEYPRVIPIDAPVSTKLIIAALAFRGAVDPAALTIMGVTHYGWTEYADYFGLITLVLFGYLLIRRLERPRSLKIVEWLILAGTFFSLAIALGNYGPFSPWTLLHNLPIFDQMRVPSRFLCWFVLGAILFLARLPRKPIIYVLLIISALDVFWAGYNILNYDQRPYTQAKQPTNQFQQHEFYNTNPAKGQMAIIFEDDFRLLRATERNYGEVYGYEPVLDLAEYYIEPKPERCGIKQGCEFVRTKNAIVTNWSPQVITLQRTATGPIELNMNPGKVWFANGKQLFPSQRILELHKEFIITDTAKNITVEFKPQR